MPDWISEFLLAAEAIGDVRLDYMPLWISVFLADDKVEMMSTEQRGAYLLLLMRAWQQDDPPASLPNDPKRLAKWAGVSESRWAKISAEVMAPFTIGPDGRLYQKRLAKEWLSSARNYLGKKRGADVTNSRRNRTANGAVSEPLSEPDSARTNQTNQPNQTNGPNEPNQPNQTGGPPLAGPDSGNGGNGSAGGLAGALRKNLDSVGTERMLQVQSRLSRLQINPDVTRELMGRNDITPEIVDREWEQIGRRNKRPDDPKALLVSILRAHKPGVRKS